MTANDLLASAIATKLTGDQERVVELFHDSSFHSKLAAAPDQGGWRNYRRQTYDGWYFVGGSVGYDVYYKERGSVQHINRFVKISAAAAYFFSATGLTKRGDNLPEGELIQHATLPPLTPSIVRSTIDALEALVLALLGVMFSFATLLVLWSSLQLPNLLAGSFSAAISFFCFYASYRAGRHTSWFRAT